MVLVDGYNILQQWFISLDDRAEKLAILQSGDLGHARERLQFLVEEYSMWRGVQLVVAWDAMGNEESSSTTR